MEDTFRVRVEKTFGSLSSVSVSSASDSSSASASASISASSVSNLWCLSDEEMEKREWNRRDLRDSPSPEDEPPQPNHPLSDLDDVKPLSLDRNNVIDADSSGPEPGPVPSEDWEIRSSIGLDCTLDNEDEEDEFDKVAVGHEELGDHLYMRDIDDYGIDYPDPISGSFDDSLVSRDPRANRMAAKLRLIEDSKADGDFCPSKISNDSAPPVKQHVKDEMNPKPILKKRETPMDTKSNKRVRFVNMSSSGGAEGSPSQGCSKEATSLLREESAPQEPTLLGETKDANTSSMDELTEALQTEVSRQVPDYIQNPSRYTRYALDSADDVDEASNKKAYLDFYNLLRKPKDADLQPDDFDPSVPMSVVFTPKKKMDDASSLKMDTMSNPIQGEALKDTAIPIAIAAANLEDDGVCDMDEDLKEDAPDNSRGSRNPSRQYRTRATVITDDCGAS